MIILAYYIFIGLLSRTSGQTVVISSNDYVNKSETVTITCAVVGNVISDIVDIAKDGILALRCPSPPVPCSSTVTAYSAVQDETAGTTTLTISAADISRDTGNWTCQHGTTSSLKAASLTVGTPVSITKMNELNTTAVIETNCTFPHAGTRVSCSVGGTDINCQFNISSSATCGELSERVLSVTIYLDLFKGSASGVLTVCIDNGFTAASKTGNHTYTFIATTTTGVTNATCKSDSAVFIILVICIIISYTIMINFFIDWIFCYLNSTISIYMACLKTGHRRLCILYIVLVIVVVVCEIVNIIMIIIGRECQTILVVGLVLDLIIIAVTIIFVVVFIITGVVICNKDTVRNPRTGSDVKITVYLRPMFFSDLKWIGPNGNPLSTDGKYIIDQYNSNTGETSLSITNVSQDDNGKYICQVKIGCKIAKNSIHIMCDKQMKTKKSGPPAIHIGTQNKTEPKTTSKQTNERPQPLPLVGGIAEDKLKPRPQPPHPEDIDAKDRNLRGLSANNDDTQGLASGTPRPIRLTPLNLNQETLQEEDVSEEKSKKKRKKRKKKGQMNEENQEEEAVELKSQRTSSED